MTCRFAIIVLAAVSAVGFLRAQDAPMPGASAVPAVAPALPRVIMPPGVPAHARRSLDSPTELVRDFAEVVAYLDAGQAYFRAYQKGSHSVEENRQFLGFLEAYEKEYAMARKEAEALKKWVIERGSLDSASKP